MANTIQIDMETRIYEKDQNDAEWARFLKISNVILT